jgi:large subunit ribosomal protein L6
MSRIGKLKINIPAGTIISADGQNLTVKGKLGELSIVIHPNISVVREDDNTLQVNRKSDAKKDRALHGLTRALVANMVTGVNDGFIKELEVVGIGYRAESKGEMLVLNIGYSHPVEFTPPADIKIEVDAKANIVKVSGINKERVGQVAADIRFLRAPDAYKGKGIRYRGEKLRLKPGKSGAK